MYWLTFSLLYVWIVSVIGCIWGAVIITAEYGEPAEDVWLIVFLLFCGIGIFPGLNTAVCLSMFLYIKSNGLK